jgi:hypothetical protein
VLETVWLGQPPLKEGENTTFVGIEPRISALESSADDETLKSEISAHQKGPLLAGTGLIGFGEVAGWTISPFRWANALALMVVPEERAVRLKFTMGRVARTRNLALDVLPCRLALRWNP